MRGLRRTRVPGVVPRARGVLTAILDQGSEFEGKLCFYGTARIGGVFRGEILTPDTLIINEGARVDAQVDVAVLVLYGEMHGTIRASVRVEMHPPAIFRGNILTPSLCIHEGVLFDGTNQMRLPESDSLGNSVSPVKPFSNLPVPRVISSAET